MMARLHDSRAKVEIAGLLTLAAATVFFVATDLRPLSAELGAPAETYHLPCRVAETEAIWFSPGSAGFLGNNYKMLKSKLDYLVIRQANRLGQCAMAGRSGLLSPQWPLPVRAS